MRNRRPVRLPATRFRRRRHDRRALSPHRPLGSRRYLGRNIAEFAERGGGWAKDVPRSTASVAEPYAGVGQVSDTVSKYLVLKILTHVS